MHKSTSTCSAQLVRHPYLNAGLSCTKLEMAAGGRMRARKMHSSASGLWSVPDFSLIMTIRMDQLIWLVLQDLIRLRASYWESCMYVLHMGGEVDGEIANKSVAICRRKQEDRRILAFQISLTFLHSRYRLQTKLTSRGWHLRE